MAGILDFLGGENLQQLVSGLSEKTGIGTDKVSSVIDSLKSMVGNSDGSELMNKLTGEEQNSTLNAISEKTGVSLSNVTDIFQNLTPMISQFFSGKGGSISDMLTSFLDKNKDGSVMDDIMGGIGNLFGKKQYYFLFVRKTNSVGGRVSTSNTEFNIKITLAKFLCFVKVIFFIALFSVKLKLLAIFSLVTYRMLIIKEKLWEGKHFDALYPKCFLDCTKIEFQ